MAILEVCADGLTAVKTAALNGADRVELCQALELGGLSPSVGTIETIKDKGINIKIIAMNRPRAGGFSYCEDEFAVCKKDAELLLKAGADGLAFGFLQNDYSFDLRKMREIAELCRKFGKEIVCHRAFDNTENPYEAIESLIDMGFTRVLTSGQQSSALKGLSLLKDLQLRYGSEIEILAGVSVSSANAVQILEETKIRQLHASCKCFFEDKTTVNKVDYSVRTEPSVYSLQTVDPVEVRKLVEICHRY